MQAGLTLPVVTAWESVDRANVHFGGRMSRDIELTAATERYFEIKDLKIVNGRAFTAQEVRSGVPVVVLGDAVASRLFEGRNPVGFAFELGTGADVDRVPPQWARLLEDYLRP